MRRRLAHLVGAGGLERLAGDARFRQVAALAKGRVQARQAAEDLALMLRAGLPPLWLSDQPGERTIEVSSHPIKGCRVCDGSGTLGSCDTCGGSGRLALGSRDEVVAALQTYDALYARILEGARAAVPDKLPAFPFGSPSQVFEDRDFWSGSNSLGGVVAGDRSPQGEAMRQLAAAHLVHRPVDDRRIMARALAELVNIPLRVSCPVCDGRGRAPCPARMDVRFHVPAGVRTGWILAGRTVHGNEQVFAVVS